MPPLKLREILQNREMNVKELANEAGVSPSTVYKALRLERLGFESVKAIAYALRLSANDIIWGRKPQCVTKPIGKNSAQSNTRANLNERLCANCKLFYPTILANCPDCE